MKKLYEVFYLQKKYNLEVSTLVAAEDAVSARKESEKQLKLSSYKYLRTEAR